MQTSMLHQKSTLILTQPNSIKIQTETTRTMGNIEDTTGCVAEHAGFVE